MGKRLLARRCVATLLVAALGVAGCGDDDASPSAEEVADLQLSSSELGEILVDAGGNTLYLFLPDDQGDSTCYDDCEASWPIVEELTTVGDGLDADLLGTTERTTGDIQATYNGWPLYYFILDVAAGDATGQGADGIWYVLDADGSAIGA